MGERDILGGQLIKRNEELQTLYQKIKIHKSTLLKGESMYDNIKGEEAGLKSVLGSLHGERDASKKSVSNLDQLRDEVYRLERELLQEQTKIRALSEELERP